MQPSFCSWEQFIAFACFLARLQLLRAKSYIYQVPGGRARTHSDTCTEHVSLCVLCAIGVADGCSLRFYLSQGGCEGATCISLQRNPGPVKESFANHTNCPAAGECLCGVYERLCPLSVSGFRTTKESLTFLISHISPWTFRT